VIAGEPVYVMEILPSLLQPILNLTPILFTASLSCITQFIIEASEFENNFYPITSCCAVVDAAFVVVAAREGSKFVPVRGYERSAITSWN